MDYDAWKTTPPDDAWTCDRCKTGINEEDAWTCLLCEDSCFCVACYAAHDDYHDTEEPDDEQISTEAGSDGTDNCGDACFDVPVVLTGLGERRPELCPIESFD